ncbi:GEVED domain-containing protein [Hymenobacter ginkgonis]|nr:GEVED domain-containing protein [Hymenobacter ginkgonis]
MLPMLSYAQCPAAASCTPGSASSALASAYSMGIYNVTLGGINNSTANYTDGYKDYSCTLGASLIVNTAAAISIRNGTAANENVRVWIDYNNDGLFGTTELAFSSDNKVLHTGTITPPATAVLNTRLRMRVASDYANIAVPTACSTPQYSQDEDYAVTVTPNFSAPVAAFSVDATTTCSGRVQFTDQSTNGATAWLWEFGDNTTSTQQNSLHTYATAGTYQVRLTATNANGTSTSAATTITYNAAVPVAASCAGLAATANCCNYGITRVQLGTIDNASADGSGGYQDFTCPQRTTLTLGVANTLRISTGGTNLHDTRAWLDLNNDGVFATSEKVLEVLNSASPSATFTVPATATLGQPLRLRLVADGVGTNPQPCVAPTLGQVEDYTVTVVANTNAPAAAFTSNYVAGACTTPANTYTFTDQSTNLPTAWLWSFSPSAGVSFVNGTSATSQNPQVAFATAGTYSVTLRATNANGSNTFTASNYLLVQVPCLTYCPANGGYATGLASSFWITNVSVSAAPGGAAFSNTSGNATGGYALFAASTIGVQAGATQTITVTTNQAFSHRVTIWADYNRDGVFANTTGAAGELLYNGTSTAITSSTQVTIPASVAPTRLRVLVALNSNTPNPCATNQGEAEVEDYFLSVPTPLATREAQALPALTVSPNPTPDGRLQLQVSEASASGTYSLAVENLLGARLLSGQVRLGVAAPAALDLAPLPAGLYLLRLTNAQGQTALRRVVRQ